MRYLSWIVSFLLFQAMLFSTLPHASAAGSGPATRTDIRAVTKAGDGQVDTFTTF